MKGMIKLIAATAVFVVFGLYMKPAFKAVLGSDEHLPFYVFLPMLAAVGAGYAWLLRSGMTDLQRQSDDLARKITDFYNPNRDIIRFIVLFFSLYLVFDTVYQDMVDSLRGGTIQADAIVTEYPGFYRLISIQRALLNNGGVFLLELSGYTGIISGTGNKHISVPGTDFYALGVEDFHTAVNCIGFDLMGLLACLMIAYPGSARLKLRFAITGLSVIQLLNILRIYGLCMLNIHAPELTTFNHDYTFQIIVYGFIFLIWVQRTRQHSTKIA